jgi:hypothetical protein
MLKLFKFLVLWSILVLCLDARLVRGRLLQLPSMFYRCGDDGAGGERSLFLSSLVCVSCLVVVLCLRGSLNDLLTLSECPIA